MRTSNVAIALEEVSVRVSRACETSGRSPSEVQIVAVSKGVDTDRISAALAAGQRVFGENRVQEAIQKAGLIPEAQWHMVGRIQRNKVRQVLQFASAIHSLDRSELADEIEARATQPIDCLAQVNVSGEASKAGMDPSDVVEFAGQCSAMAKVNLVGLMTVPPPTADPEGSRPFFRLLRNLRDLVSQELESPGIHHLSMGMSQDYGVAVEEGATLLRIGTAIFGRREE
ncbi:MAG TPA: YggS family pyridoxal phosphate-dependent enzyme [Actinomycetota bacterium]|nr:YggS family pyridoxal phosphate-dependent enzyme [Actinomycetota bacterium]